ncbi:MAG: MFS transporter [Oscillospiraceae bacterium]|nr:MFS transporter [Oscillospiraceae bacterium]
MLIKKNIILMYAVALLQGRVFYAPIATLYRQAAGVGIFEITLIESVSLGLCVALELPWGVVADRIGYKKTMLVCCGLYFLSKIIFWRADGFWMFLAERVLLAVVIAGLSGVDTSILYLSSGAESSQRIFGRYDGMTTIGMLFAALVYSAFVGDDYRLAGLLTVVSYGAAALLALGLEEVHAPSRQADALTEFKAALRAALRDRSLLLLLLAGALLTEARQTICVFLNQLQYVRCGMDSRAIGAAFICLMLSELVAPLSDGLTKRLGERRLGVVLFGAAAVACFALALTDSGILSVIGILCVSVACSLFRPLLNALQNRRIASKNRATALSINAVLMDGVAIATNLTYGGVAQRSLPAAFGAGGIFCAAGLVLFLCFFRRDRAASRFGKKEEGEICPREKEA